MSECEAGQGQGGACGSKEALFPSVLGLKTLIVRSGAGRLRGIEKLCNDSAIGKKCMRGLPIQIRLCLMFGTPSSGLELDHRDAAVNPADQAVDGAADDRAADPERERDLVERGTRLVEHSKTLM